MNTTPLFQTPKLSFNCPKEWEQMVGSETTRRCSACDHLVHNLSEMPLAELRALLERSKSESICGTFLLRLNGELVTSRHPPALRDRSRAVTLSKGLMSAAAFTLAMSCIAQTSDDRTKPTPTPTPNCANAGTENDEEVILLTGMMIDNFEEVRSKTPQLVDRSHKPEMHRSPEKIRDEEPDKASQDKS